LLTLPATVVLWRAARGDRPKQISLLIFGLSLSFCYAASTLYHAVRLPQPQIDFYEIIDFIAIYFLIAGTCTPIAFNILEGRWKWVMLILAWGLALLGSLIRLLVPEIPQWLYTSVYLGMGWAMISCYFELTRVLSRRTVWPLLQGCLFYTAGSLINMLPRTSFWPPSFGPHDLFHLFAMAGSLEHFWFMLKVVVPYERIEELAPEGTREALGNSLA
jgi:hemolysin III